MAVPNLGEEIAQDYGPNTQVVEVTPGAPDDPFSTANSQPTDPPPAPAEGGTDAAGAQAAGGTAGEPNQPAPSEPEPTAAPGGEGEDEPPQLTPEQVQGLQQLRENIAKELEDELLEKAVAKVREEEIPKVQSGLDRRVTELRAEYDSMKAERDALEQQIRDKQIEGLTPEDQEKMREAWANEDKKKELDEYADELDGWYTDTLAQSLVLQYGQYGVTAEALEEVDPDDWQTFCKDTQIDYLTKNPPSNGTQTEPAPSPAASAPAQPPAPPAPPGASARSDAGADGVPPAPPEINEGKGSEAMTDNLSKHGWQSADQAFAAPRT